MRLKNKKTGEIGYLYEHSLTQDMIIVYNVRGIVSKYTSLAELERDWEDAPEEPKEYWYIDYDGGILCGETDNSSAEKMMISMGNHFESLEEAEKAVEKLRAYKRLKDKGFRLDAVVDTFFCLDIFMKDEQYEAIKDDLKIVFGGED